MPVLEAEIEDRTVAQAKKHGYTVRKLSFLGVRGAPDRLFGREAACLIIEFKRPGEEPTAQQFKRHKELRTCFGFQVMWTDNYEDACTALGIPA